MDPLYLIMAHVKPASRKNFNTYLDFSHLYLAHANFSQSKKMHEPRTCCTQKFKKNEFQINSGHTFNTSTWYFSSFETLIYRQKCQVQIRKKNQVQHNLICYDKQAGKDLFWMLIQNHWNLNSILFAKDLNFCNYQAVWKHHKWQKRKPWMI